MNKRLKKLLFLFFALLLFVAAETNLYAQKITVILVRHAEKDVSPGADKVNPDLTEAGRQRVERLVEKVKGYKPNEVFSSNFTRTKLTAQPVARKFGLPIHLYDPNNLKELYDLILTTDKRVFVIVGHNNSTPALANMLIKQQKYVTLPETEYGKIFVIKIDKDKITDKVIDY